MKNVAKYSLISFILLPMLAFPTDGREISKKLTCYNYDERIVFILDLTKNNETLNSIRLKKVNRNKDSIKIETPNMTIDFDSHNYILSVKPNKASEPLKLDCTDY